MFLALGGGGARGSAHLGVLDILEREGLRPAGIAGTSAGALVAAAYAGGWSPEELLSRARSLAWRDLVGFSRQPLSSSLLRVDPFRRLLREEMGLRRFSDLRVPVAVVATDLRSGSAVVLERDSGDLDLTEAILASCAIPGCFPPIVDGSRYLVDGGVVENLPVRVARKLAADHAGSNRSVVVSVDLMAYPANGRLPAGIFESWQRCVWLMVSASQGGDAGEVEIRPSIAEFGFTDLSAADDLFERGAEAARAALPALREFTRSSS